MKNYSKISMVATDLDGTFLRNDKSISEEDYNALLELKEKNIKVVAATGRSLFKVKDVLSGDIPFDYIVFSSGAGIYDWKKNILLQSEHFEKVVINRICNYLFSININFIVFEPIPNNNLFRFHKGAGECGEFDRYLERHDGDYTILDENDFPKEAGQILAIIPNNEDLFKRLKNEIYSACKDVKVIRATSPVDNNFIWLEIFPASVSKGHGLKWLCEYLNIDTTNTVGIGNDFNDLDMFEFVEFPFVIGNGVDAIKSIYKSIDATNEQNGFSKVVRDIL